jgi:cytochrome c551/c552
MDVLKQIALPQSPEHFRLLLLVLNITTSVLIPYMAFLLVSSFLALRAERRAGRTTGQAAPGAGVLMDTAMASKGLVAFLGVIPAFTLVFVSAQILQSTEAMAVGLFLAGALAFLAAAVLLYAYRITFRVSGAMAGLLPYARQSREAASAIQEAEHLDRAARAAHNRTGRWGFFFLVISTGLFIGGLTITASPNEWGSGSSGFALFLSPMFLIRYVQFLTIAVAVTGVGLLFFRSGYQIAGLPVSAWAMAMTGLLAQPLVLTLSTMALPQQALSGTVYALTGLAVMVFFLAAVFLYAMKTNHKPWQVSAAFAATVLGVIVLSTADQVSIGTATRTHALGLSAAYDRSIVELKKSLGIGAPAMTGEEIYGAKCSACHLFDQKKVGPPYRDVLQKYAGRKAALVSFVLSPVKVDPAYPAMPGQGLRPAEADSIVTFLLSKYPVAGGGTPDTGGRGPQENSK